MPPDPEPPWVLLCHPCLDLPPRHEDCDPAEWCECLTEVLIEAEEAE